MNILDHIEIFSEVFHNLHRVLSQPQQNLYTSLHGFTVNRITPDHAAHRIFNTADVFFKQIALCFNVHYLCTVILRQNQTETM